MEKMMGCAVLVFGLMVLVLNATAISPNDITCADAVKALLPCQSFLVGTGPVTAPPSSDCCQGAQSVLKEANTPETLRALCVCFKDAAKKLGVNPDRAGSIPKFCDMKVPVPIDPDVDCTK
ncbi:Non-specific lipid-transfer protein [Morella rubra]|uniref:Non-specific lipid-transfer protein n=1 Tax=Morella rubra TaxID=262757 RepID=A0A6A1W8Z8_9ROSI|nr:Non-specific lipid-transfer protein [Morella rubra]